MRRLNLSNLKVGVRDLLEKRKADLLLTDAGKYYEPRLAGALAAIEALPPALTGGAPLAAELDAADDAHDGFGAALFFVTEVYLRLPDAPPALVAAAKRVREAFVPELGDLVVPYSIEADNAADRRPRLQERKADLELFALADGRTLFDVATKLVDAGEHLGTLLSQRADVPKAQRKDAGRLRSAAVGALFRLRKDLVEEVAKNAALPRDLEHRVFGYFDTLADMQARAARPAPAQAGAPVEAEAPPK